jgi:hypothetical protein
MPHANTLAPGEPGYAVFERQLLAIKRLLDAGLIKNWGLSNENAFGITMFCTLADKLGMARPVSCQNDFSLLNRTYESDTWEAAYRFGVVGLPYGCLAGGVLTGKYFDGTKWSQAAAADRPLDLCRMRKEKDFQPRYGMPMAMLAAAEYIKLAEQYGFSHVWTFDSHILWQEPYVIYSKILAETHRITVGPFVTNPATRDWTVTASVFATLTELYGNRTIVGIGRGDSAVFKKTI